MTRPTAKRQTGPVDRSVVTEWVAGYEQAWRTPGTAALAQLFTPEASYRPSPWASALRGLEQIAAFWEAERDGPEEVFTMTHQVVAIDGQTAVVRVEVDYGQPTAGRWRDLWVIRLHDDGRCRDFEEWPFAPDQPDGH